MAITLSENARDAAANGIVDLIDAGAGAGTLEIKSAPSTAATTSEVATLTFQTTAFLAASVGVAAADTIVSDTTATGGTASDYTVFDSDGNAVWQGSVTLAAGGGDIELSSVGIGANDTVSISTFTLTVPPS